MAAGIYTITAPSGNQYVGSTTCFYKRWHRHRKELAGGTHHSSRLQDACRKYGLENLTFQRVLICEKPMLLFYEQLVMDAFRPRYNVLRIAGSSLGHKQSPEVIAKRAASMRGRPCSPETREKISAAQRGRKLTAAHRAALLARPAPSAETKAKISAAVKAAATPEVRAKLRAAVLGTKRAPRRAEWTAKLVAALTGKTHSAATRAKMSAVARAKPRTEAQIMAIQRNRAKAHSPEAEAKRRAAREQRSDG